MTPEPDFDFLISRYLDGTLSADEAAMLSDWVKQDTANADRVALAALLHSRMYDVLHSQRILADENLSHDPLDDAAVMPAIRLAEESESAEVTDSPAVPQTTKPVAAPATRRHGFWNYRRAAAVLIAGATLGVIATIVSNWPQHQPPNATIASTINAAWDGDQKLATGDVVPGGVLALKSGFVEIHLQRGASVILEGPAQLQVLSNNSVSFLEGKLSAKVPESAHGFVVQTQTARVTDLGTEFGVSVDGSGVTEVQVFQGNVEAERLEAAPGTPPTHLIPGVNATVTARKLAVENITAESATTFVRTLAPQTEPLDVLDLICGGDGTTHRRSFHINQNTGDADYNALPSVPRSADDISYHRIAGFPVLDGTFVPSQNSLVDSARHRFLFQNANGSATFHIYVGGNVQWPKPVNGVPYPVFLGGVDYSLAPHGFLFCHANAGLTLNLSEIRRLHPGTPLKTFEAVVGNFRTQFSPEHPETTNSRADAYVLVDGVPRFSRLDFTRKRGAIPIQIPIKDNDRFMTLAITEGTDTPNSDWIAFGDPRLE